MGKLRVLVTLILIASTFLWMILPAWLMVSLIFFVSDGSKGLHEYVQSSLEDCGYYKKLLKKTWRDE